MLKEITIWYSSHLNWWKFSPRFWNLHRENIFLSMWRKFHVYFSISRGTEYWVPMGSNENWAVSFDCNLWFENFQNSGWTSKKKQYQNEKVVYLFKVFQRVFVHFQLISSEMNICNNSNKLLNSSNFYWSFWNKSMQKRADAND